MTTHMTVTSRVIAVGVIRRTGLSAHIADCRIELDHGDITQESTRAIVNSVCGGNKMGGGECNAAITRSAGTTVANEYQNNATGNDIVMTKAGNLRQDKIFHVVARNDVAGMRNVVDRTMKKAETEELDSIAFPALGTGHLGGDAKKLAVPMFEAMRDFAQKDRPIVLRTIKVVIYKAELFDIYKEAMQETLAQYCVE